MYFLLITLFPRNKLYYYINIIISNINNKYNNCLFINRNLSL